MSDLYREMAAKARRDAEAAALPNVRQLHLQSAERLDEIAQGIERVAQAKTRNDVAKQALLR